MTTAEYLLQLIKTLTTRRGRRVIMNILVLMTLFTLVASPVQSAPVEKVDPAAPLALPPTWKAPIIVDDAEFFQNMTDRSFRFKPYTKQPCVAYGGDGLYYSCYDWLTKKWVTEVVDSGARVGEYAALDFTTTSDPVISYYDAFNGTLKIAYKVLGLWNFETIEGSDCTHTGLPPFTVVGSPLGDGSLTQLEIPAPDVTDVQQVEESPPQSESNEPVVEDTAQPVEGDVQSTVESTPERTGTPIVESTPLPDGGNEQEAIQETPPVEPGVPQDVLKAAKQKLLDTLAGRLWREPLLETSTDSSSALIAEDAGGVGKYTSIDIDPNNVLHVSFYDTERKSLNYLTWNWLPGQKHCQVVEDWDDQGKVGLYTSIAVFYKPTVSKYIIHISYMNEKYDQLKYAKKSFSNEWFETFEIEDRVSGTGWFTSIAVGNDGTPHVSYYDGYKGNLKYANLDDPEHPVTMNVDAGGDVGLYTSIAYDNADQQVIISYYDATNGNLKYANAENPNDADDWHKHTLYEGGEDGDVGYWTSIDLGVNERKGITYYNHTDGLLQWMYRDGDEWFRNDVNANSAADLGLSTSLVIDTDDVPHISYFEDSRDHLKYARVYSNLKYTTVVSDTIRAGAFSSIGIRNNQPLIAFYDMDHGDLLTTTIKTQGWDFDDVDTSGDNGQYVSMKIDSNGIPHVVYFYATNQDDVVKQDLKYAKWNTSSWDIITLDSLENVGMFASLALDSNDRAYVSYIDATNRNLKFTYQEPLFNAWIAPVVVDPSVPTYDRWDENKIKAYTSIAVDDTNPNYPGVHITYYDAYPGPISSDPPRGRLKYARGVNTLGAITWPEVGTIIDDGAGEDKGKWNSLVWDPVDTALHVCYYEDFIDTPEDGNLRYAYRTGAGEPPGDNWTGQTTIDGEGPVPNFSVGDVGAYCSIAISSGGEPAISYYDASKGALKLIFSTTFVLPDADVSFLPIILNDYGTPDHCDDAYPTVCIPSPPPDLQCANIPYRDFVVLDPDPHNFDPDNDGIGCET
ncbi:MAG: hypothetical protein WBF05_16225 [Anaerolineales bacterium]